MPFCHQYGWKQTTRLLKRGGEAISVKREEKKQAWEGGGLIAIKRFKSKGVFEGERFLSTDGSLSGA